MTTKIVNHSLKEEAEMVLYDISMNFELHEGKRFKWRKNSQQLFLMIDEAFNSPTIELVRKAIHFFKMVPHDIQYEFISRRILPPTEEQLKKRLYRGVLTKPEDTQPQQEKTVSNSTLHYRGVAIDRSSTDQKEQHKPTKSKKVKRIWRGVVTYTDE